MSLPAEKIHSRRALLQRRKSLTTTVQAAVDGLIVLGTIYLVLRINEQSFSVLDSAYMITLLIVMGITYDRMGIYRKFESPLDSLKQLTLAWSFSLAISTTLFLMSDFIDQNSRTSILYVYSVGLAGQLLNRWIVFKIQSYKAKIIDQQRNVLLVGGGPLVKHLYEKINKNPWLLEHAIGHIACSNTSDEISVPTLGSQDELLDVVRKYNVEAVYIAVSLENSKLVEDYYLALVNENIDVHWVPNIFSLDLVNHSVKEIAGLPLLTLSESPLIGNHLLFKAVMDKCIATALVCLLSPVMLIVAILIKLDSPGPVIFRQPRNGWNGKTFDIWKFRSMRVNTSEETEFVQAIKNDDRFTRVGRFIRRTSIDELPQLFNVIAGEMSLVGPRPHAIEHNSDFVKKIAAYMSRHRIKPGITGLAQINGYRGETQTLDQMKGRVAYDMEYINNWSFWLDIKILFKTIPALLRDEAF